jgi:hypothetical protein
MVKHLMSKSYFLCGELTAWPDKDRMASILLSAGLKVGVHRYKIALDDFSHFAFTEYGGDLGEPQIEADADNAEELAANARRVSGALSNAGLVHRFEIYEYDHRDLLYYFHHGWPLKNRS